MKRNAGFTLIELVIVIVVLGILAVTAAPKFLNLQSDARKSAIQGLAGAMNSAASIVYSKSVMNGYDASGATNTVTSGNASVAVVWGYPTSASIWTALDLSSNDWTSGASGTSVVYWQTTAASVSSSCNVTYTAPTASGSRPTISASTSC